MSCKTPAIILTPFERILEVSTITKVQFIIPASTRTIITPEVFEKNPPYDYCAIYITTERFIFIPVLDSVYRNEDILAMFYSGYVNCISLQSNEILNIKLENSIEITMFDTEKLKLIRLADAIIYANFQARTNSNDAAGNSSIAYEALFETGKRIIFNENPCGENKIIGNLSNEMEEKSTLPTYDDSERAVGNLFKSMGFFDHVKISSTHKSEAEAKLVFVKSDELESQLGMHHVKYLARNCLKYTQRNIKILEIGRADRILDGNKLRAEEIAKSLNNQLGACAYYRRNSNYMESVIGLAKRIASKSRASMR